MCQRLQPEEARTKDTTIQGIQSHRGWLQSSLSKSCSKRSSQSHLREFLPQMVLLCCKHHQSAEGESGSACNLVFGSIGFKNKSSTSTRRTSTSKPMRGAPLGATIIVGC